MNCFGTWEWDILLMVHCNVLENNHTFTFRIILNASFNNLKDFCPFVLSLRTILLYFQSIFFLQLYYDLYNNYTDNCETNFKIYHARIISKIIYCQKKMFNMVEMGVK